MKQALAAPCLHAPPRNQDQRNPALPFLVEEPGFMQQGTKMTLSFRPVMLKPEPGDMQTHGLVTQASIFVLDQ